MNIIYYKIIIILYLIIVFLLLFKLNDKINPILEKFGGLKHNSNKLNNDLKIITNILNKNNINNWFIAYGTLLGIIRENSCIDNDDDVDIICDIKNKDKLLNILRETYNNFDYNANKNRDIIVLREPISVDIYMANIDKNGNFYDKWNKIKWTNCFINNKLIKKIWKDNILYLPNNYIEHIENKYGKNWKIPSQNKGVKNGTENNYTVI
tara:strand:+ start:1694 stop:2320 length:627 start_codon:yes stop_codon:yes gene_type:complete